MELQLFDFDGTIAYTSDALFLAYQQSFKEHGYELDREMWDLFYGRSMHELCKSMNVPGGIARSIRDRKYEIYPKIFMEKIRLVRFTKLFYLKHNVTNIICTTTETKVVNEILHHFKIESFFKNVFDKNHVVYTKPNPDVFIRAAKSEGVGPETAWTKNRVNIFEDSDAGIEAAKRFRKEYYGLCKIWKIHGKNGKYSYEC